MSNIEAAEPVNEKEKFIPTNAMDGKLEVEAPPRRRRRWPKRLKPKRVKKWFGENLILVLTILGVIIGVVIGLAVKIAEDQHDFELSDDWKVAIAFPGEILMRMLKCLIVPLITASLISGLTQLDMGESASIGRRALLYYFSTTAIAVVTGMILVVIIHPGDPNIRSKVVSGIEDKKVTALDAFLDLVRNLFPDNIIQAAFMSSGTVYKNETVQEMVLPKEAGLPGVTTATHKNRTIYYREYFEDKRHIEQAFGMNMLGIITFCIAFGIVLARMGPRGQVMIDFFQILNEVSMSLVMVVVWYSPIGIAFLIAGRIVMVENLAVMMVSLSKYMATVITGLVLHGFIVLPTIYFAITRKNPLTFLKGMIQAWVMALATASSSATMPFTFHCLEDKNGVDMRVTRFVIPIGSTVNMDGTALYEAVAAIFIAQMNGMAMSIGKVITISVTATLASIGAASIPSAGLVTMIVVLSSVGLPIDDISLIVAVDWLLDRIRTSINVLGDSFGAGIVYELSKKELEAMDKRRALEEEKAAFVGDSADSLDDLDDKKVSSSNL